MTETKLIVNGVEFPVGYELLCQIASSLPRGRRRYRELSAALLKLKLPSITSELIRKDVLNDADRDEIWQEGDIDLRRQLARDMDFVDNLSDSQAQEIIDLDDIEILRGIAGLCERLYPEEGEERAARLSGRMADALMHHLRSHPNQNVRAELAENRSTPFKFRLGFGECLHEGLSVATALANMEAGDIALLPNCSREVLVTIAENVEDIKDRNVREQVVKFLCDYNDPGVRLALAENHWAPRSAFDLLASDVDPDIAAEAASVLEEKDS